MNHNLINNTYFLKKKLVVVLIKKILIEKENFKEKLLKMLKTIVFNTFLSHKRTIFYDFAKKKICK